MTDYGWPDLIGNIGVALIVGAYLALQLGRLDGRAPLYSITNAIGAALVLVSLWFDFNLSAFIVEMFWVVISLIGLVRNLNDPSRMPRRVEIDPDRQQGMSADANKGRGAP